MHADDPTPRPDDPSPPTPTRHERAGAWFDELAALDGAARARRAAELEAEDPQLLREVLELLALDARAGSALDTPASDLLAHPAELGELPERVGDFEVLELLGRGGMGVVYRARQEHPTREVALKVLRPELALSELRQRFEREGEVLARLNHPAIAHVYGAGTADAGGHTVAYLSMELVEGTSVDRWAEATDAPLRARLELLAQVADAVQHAHEQGVVHRDLKPSNLLVTADGRPKVLDFGVALALDGERANATAVTTTGEIVGTLQYMSPEQVRGDRRVDERADVYALGMVAYELLCGERPYSTARLPVHLAAQVVLGTEPLPLGKRDPRLAGDVTTIVAHALEKEPGRRYPSAAALADDLRRTLSDRPILARPATRAYRAWKFARRNKLWLGATAAVFLSLLLGLVGMAWRADQARRAEAIATARLDRALEVSRLMTAFFQTVDPEQEGPDARVVHMLDRSRSLLDDAGGRSPLVDAALHQAIGQAYLSLGQLDRGREHVEAGLELRRVHGAEPWERAESLESTARLLLQSGGQDPAVPLGMLREALALRTRTHGPDDPFTLWTQLELIDAEWDFGPHAGQLERLRDVVERARAVLPEGDDSLTRFEFALVDRLIPAGALDEAEAILDGLLAASERAYGPDALRTSYVHVRRTQLYLDQGRVEEAEEAARTLLEISRARLPEGHPTRGSAAARLGTVLRQQGRYAEALPLYEEFLDVQRALHDVPGRSVARALQSLGSLYLDLGRPDEAEPLLREALEVGTLENGATPRERGLMLESLGILTSWRGDLEGALDLQRQANALFAEDLEAELPEVGRNLLNEGLLLQRLRRNEEAVGVLEKAYRMLFGVHGPLHPATAQCAYESSLVLRRLGRAEEGLARARLALESGLELFDPDHPTPTHARLQVMHCLLDLAEAAGTPEEAAPYYAESVELGVEALEHLPEERARPFVRRALVRALEALGRADEADAYRDA